MKLKGAKADSDILGADTQIHCPTPLRLLHAWRHLLFLS